MNGFSSGNGDFTGYIMLLVIEMGPTLTTDLDLECLLRDLERDLDLERDRDLERR